MSDSPGPNGLLHARLPCPSPTPRSCSNSHTHIHWVGDAIQPSHPLSSPSPPVLNLPQHQCLFQWIRWPKYWSFSFSITASSEYLGMIPFRIDWIDLLAVQETLRSLVQHYSLNISVLWSSAFFMVQLSHPYMTTGKTVASTIQTIAGKVMSLLFNMVSSLVIAFLLRSKRLLISWLQWFWSQRKYSFSLFPLFPHLFAMKWWDRMPWSLFLNVKF